MARWRSIGEAGSALHLPPQRAQCAVVAGMIQDMIRAGWMFIIAQQQVTYHKSIQPWQRYLVTVRPFV
jgi:hypothetical protein